MRRRRAARTARAPYNSSSLGLPAAQGLPGLPLSRAPPARGRPPGLPGPGAWKFFLTLPTRTARWAGLGGCAGAGPVTPKRGSHCSWWSVRAAAFNLPPIMQATSLVLVVSGIMLGLRLKFGGMRPLPLTTGSSIQQHSATECGSVTVPF